MKKLLTVLLVIISLASCHKPKYTSGWEAYPQPAGERPKVVCVMWHYGDISTFQSRDLDSPAFRFNLETHYGENPAKELFEYALPDTTIEYKRPHSTYIKQ